MIIQIRVFAPTVHSDACVAAIASNGNVWRLSFACSCEFSSAPNARRAWMYDIGMWVLRKNIRHVEILISVYLIVKVILILHNNISGSSSINNNTVITTTTRAVTAGSTTTTTKKPIFKRIRFCRKYKMLIFICLFCYNFDELQFTIFMRAETQEKARDKTVVFLLAASFTLPTYSCSCSWW